MKSLAAAVAIEKLRFLTGQIQNNPSSLQKWAGFRRLGYSQEQLEPLRRDLLDFLRYGSMTKLWKNHWGERINMEYRLTAPNGKNYKLISAWILRYEENLLDLVTAIPKL